MRLTSLNIRRFLERDDGATAVEYAVMLALIIVACLTAINTFGDATARLFQDSSSRIESITPDAGG